MMLNPTAPHRQHAAWLDQLALLAELPYSSLALAPAVIATLRGGMVADFGAMGWLRAGDAQPLAYWPERSSVEATRWIRANLHMTMQDFPMAMVIAADCEPIRQLCNHPDFESHWLYQQVLQRVGVRYMMEAVLPLGADGHALIDLYRAASHGPFTDAEQARLREARDALRGLSVRARPTTLPPCPTRPADSATLHFDAASHMLARSDWAVEVLYLCHGTGLDMLEWASEDVSALPPAARAMLSRLMSEPAAPGQARCEVRADAGVFDCHAQRLLPPGGGAPQFSVTITHHEPLDLAVARRLHGWPLGPQEKRLLVASTRHPSHEQLAEHLGVTAGSLKVYINRLQQRLDVPSRQALIERVLAGGAGEASEGRDGAFAGGGVDWCDGRS